MAPKAKKAAEPAPAKAAAKAEAKKAAPAPAPEPVKAAPAPTPAAAPAKAAAKAEAKKGQAGKKEEVKKDASVALKDKGNAAFERQEYPTALEFYTKAIEADASAHVCYSNRSATYAALKNFPKALEDAEKVISLKSDWPKGFYRKGAALEALLRYPEAYQAYAAGLAIDPNDVGLKKAAGELKEVMDELKMGAETKSQNQDGKENPDVDKFDAMCNWLREGGGLFPKLYLMYYSDDYRGVHCLTKVPADEVILYVPLKHIMTSEVAKGSDIGKKIIQSGVELRSTHSYLAAYLLQEKHKKGKSFWEPYLRILPVHYANMPLSFDEEQLAWLKGSMCLQKIADRIDSLRREYENIRRHVPEFGKYTLDEFVWARLVVITRIFGLVIEGNKTDGLVPYADMLNHKKPSEVAGGKDECETKWTFDDPRNGFIITSLKTIQRGDQVYDSYGRKCNSRFFVNYGFALDENTEDNESMLRVCIPPNDPHYHMKLRYLGGREHSARREFQIPASYREKKTKELFSFLRFVHAQDSELMVLSSADGFKLDEIEPISVRNEIKVLEDVKRAAADRLTHFPDTLEHDLKLLASNTLEMYSNYRNSVVMRRGEKEVLQWFVDLADKMIPYLKMPWKDVRKISAKCAQGTSNFDAYVTMVVAPLVKKAT